MSIVNEIVEEVHNKLSDVEVGSVEVSFDRVILVDQLNIIHTLQRLGLKTELCNMKTNTWKVIKEKASNYEKALEMGYKGSLAKYEEALEKYKALRAEPNMTVSRFCQLFTDDVNLKNATAAVNSVIKDSNDAFSKFCDNAGLNTDALNSKPAENTPVDPLVEFSAENIADKLTKHMASKEYNKAVHFQVRGSDSFRRSVTDLMLERGFAVLYTSHPYGITLCKVELDTSYGDENKTSKARDGLSLAEMVEANAVVLDMSAIMEGIRSSILAEDVSFRLDVGEYTAPKIKRLRDLGYTVEGNPQHGYLVSGW